MKRVAEASESPTVNAVDCCQSSGMEGGCCRDRPSFSCLFDLTSSRAWRPSQHDCALVNTMRDCREKEAQDSAKFSETCNLPSFGSSSAADTNMSYEALSLKNNFPEEMCGELDRDIFTRLLLHGATASAGYFRTTLTDLFSGANIQEGHSKSSSYDPKALTIAFAPVKGLGRTLVKFDEYALEGSKRQWPVTPQIRDTLRAKVEAPNGDLFADATNAIMSIFDVREGNGRLKNNLMAPKHQPPNLLINLVLRPPDRPPIMAEVQIFLREIEQLNEHRYYEVRD